MKFLLLTAILASTTLPAFAQEPPEFFRDANNAVYVMNTTPSFPLTIIYDNVHLQRRLRVNNCGIAVFRRTTAFLTHIGTSSTDLTPVTNLPTQLLPRCIDGQLEEPRTTHFLTPDQDVVLVGQAPNQTIIYYVSERERTVQANACGFARYPSATAYSHVPGRLMHLIPGDQGYEFSSLPLMEAPLCRSGQLFFPDSWPSIPATWLNY
jgi:hypothetical protein